MVVLLDSYAWFEYFFGTTKGVEVKKIIESDERVIVSAVNLTEVYAKYLQANPGEAEEKKAFMLARSNVVDAGKEICLEAARIRVKHGFGLADSIVLATARKEKAVIVTGDKHFKQFEGVRML